MNIKQLISDSTYMETQDILELLHPYGGEITDADWDFLQFAFDYIINHLGDFFETEWMWFPQDKVDDEMDSLFVAFSIEDEDALSFGHYNCALRALVGQWLDQQGYFNN